MIVLLKKLSLDIKDIITKGGLIQSHTIFAYLCFGFFCYAFVGFIYAWSSFHDWALGVKYAPKFSFMIAMLLFTAIYCTVAFVITLVFHSNALSGKWLVSYMENFDKWYNKEFEKYYGKYTVTAPKTLEEEFEDIEFEVFNQERFRFLGIDFSEAKFAREPKQIHKVFDEAMQNIFKLNMKELDRYYTESRLLSLKEFYLSSARFKRYDTYTTTGDFDKARKEILILKVEVKNEKILERINILLKETDIKQAFPNVDIDNVKFLK